MVIFNQFLAKILAFWVNQTKTAIKTSKMIKNIPVGFSVNACGVHGKCPVGFKVNACGVHGKFTPLKPLLLLNFLGSLTIVLNTIVKYTIAKTLKINQLESVNQILSVQVEQKKTFSDSVMGSMVKNNFLDLHCQIITIGFIITLASFTFTIYMGFNT